MNIKQKIIPLFTLFMVTAVLLAVVIPQQLAAEPLACNSTGFVITDADANWCESTTDLSGVFNTLLDLVAPRVAFDYARANYMVELTAVSPAMNTALNQVADRIGFDYARSNQQMSLSFPVELVNDTAVPQLVGEVTATPLGGMESQIGWVTNELATSRVQFGTQPGNYTGDVLSTLYVKDHRMTLTGLQDGTTYYYKLSSTDLSGNTFNSQEYTFTFTEETNVYLPMIVR